MKNFIVVFLFLCGPLAASEMSGLTQADVRAIRKEARGLLNELHSTPARSRAHFLAVARLYKTEFRLLNLAVVNIIRLLKDVERAEQTAAGHLDGGMKMRRTVKECRQGMVEELGLLYAENRRLMNLGRRNTDGIAVVGAPEGEGGGGKE